MVTKRAWTTAQWRCFHLCKPFQIYKHLDPPSISSSQFYSFVYGQNFINMAKTILPPLSIILQWTIYTYAAFMLLSSLKPHVEKFVWQPRVLVESLSPIETKDFSWTDVWTLSSLWASSNLTPIDYSQEASRIPSMLQWSLLYASQCPYGLECNWERSGR